ncbi:MAG: porin [Gammaproteobacteria bacterium]
MLRTTRRISWPWATLALLLCAQGAHAQINASVDSFELTLEGYANATTAFANERSSNVSIEDGDPRVDAALRALLRWTNVSGPDVGLRAVVERSPEKGADLAETSLLIFGHGGRLEIGDRQGLPDVLLGYAPNPFTFTGAEFGPASGPSLDPGGGLQAAFFGAPLAGRIRDLAVLGFAASLSDDRSAKVLYVTPKTGGWLAGVSYAANASDPRFEDLAQAGLAHDTYWDANVLHVGGSYSFAHAANAEGVSRRDVHSINVGATLVLDYDWMLGASITYDGISGLPYSERNLRSPSNSWGSVVSVNYNFGAWTAGAFVQRATRDSDVARPGTDVLTAFEAGLSYRVSTRLRLYGAWYGFDLDDEDQAPDTDRHHGQIFLFGLRATL